MQKLQKEKVDTLDKFRLDGKIAVVTGAVGLLGPVWCRALLEAGATVAGFDLARVKISQEFVDLKKEFGEKLALVRADITNRKSVEKAKVWCQKKYGVATILVNNAAIDQPPMALRKGYYFEDIPLEVGEKILDVNVLGAFQMIQVIGGEMVKKRDGSIINIASHYGLVSPDPHFYDHIKTDPPFLKPPMYGPSKAALVQLTRYMAVLWGKYNVRSNAISPGGVFNNQDPRFVKKYSSRVPLGRMANKEDLVGPLVFLASDASSYVTGENLIVDGGFTAL